MALFQRELHSYFLSAMAYVVMATYLFFCGLAAAATLEMANQARLDVTMREIFGWMEFLAIILVPLITMRLVAEERKSGTLEMLVTAPISDPAVVLAKFCGSLFFYLVLQAPTLLYVYILAQYGNPEYGSVITGYLGLTLVGALYLSIGLLVSTVAQDQMVAALVTFVVLLVLHLLAAFAQLITFTALGIRWSRVVEYVGIVSRYQALQSGVLDTRDLAYFLTGTAVFLFLAVRALESRRWR